MYFFPSLIRDAEKFAEEDRKVMEKITLGNEIEEYAYTLKQSIEDSAVQKKYALLTAGLIVRLTVSERNEITEAVDECLTWMETNPDATLEQLKDAKKKLERKCMPIMGKIYS